MSEKNYSTADIQAVANGIRKQILGVALKTGGCYLAQACSSAEIIASLYTRVMNLGPSVGSWEPIPFPGVPGPDNMDYQRGSSYNGAPAPDKDRFFVSCCHYASVIYAALAETGRISPDCMDKFNVDGWNMEKTALFLFGAAISRICLDETRCKLYHIGISLCPHGNLAAA